MTTTSSNCCFSERSFSKSTVTGMPRKKSTKDSPKPLCGCQRRIAFDPLVLVNLVFVDVKSGRCLRETRGLAEACYRCLRILSGRIHTDKLDVVVAVVHGMHVLQHINSDHRTPPSCS